MENKADKKSKSGKDKLPTFIRQMIFNASEPIPADLTDEDGNPITERNEVVDQYATLLECTNAGLMRQHLHFYMNDKNQCSAVLPLSTCVAIHMGKLRWDSIDVPEAFSLLACYHWAASAAEAAQIDGTDAVSMHLRAAEGNGINDADVQKATKVVLLAPKDIDVLGKQLGIFSVVCGAILGTKSDIVRELNDWVQHMTEHETTYRNLQARDPTFATKLACHIDRKIQLYLLECARAESPDDVSTAMLSFTEVQRLILEARFRHPMDTYLAQQTSQSLVQHQADITPTFNRIIIR